MTWTKVDEAAALDQGWNLYDCYDDGKFTKIIQRNDQSKLLETDEKARLFVKMMADKNDALALKAVRIVFQSRMPDFDAVVKNTRRRTTTT